jgi:hypothetical protein
MMSGKFEEDRSTLKYKNQDLDGSLFFVDSNRAPIVQFLHTEVPKPMMRTKVKSKMI